MAQQALQTRWLLIERTEISIHPLMLDVLITWIALIFVSFGYSAPPNATVRTALFLGATALAACIFLIVEMDSPFEDLIRVSSAPMRNALAHMSQ